MKIRFDYNYQMKYLLKTWSNLDIKGKGEWDVNVHELSEEFCISNLEFNDFLKEYFQEELDIAGEVVFNKEDIKILSEYCTEYKNENRNN